MNTEDLFKADPYGLDASQKKDFLSLELKNLTAFHKENGKEYSNILKAIQKDNIEASTPIEQLPFLPVRLFKLLELKSVDSASVIKTLTSSGTTSQIVSKIFLDKTTASLQTKALVHIVKSFIGNQRLPMIIIDTPNVIKNRKSYSARGAGIMGMVNFGRNHFYLLDDDMNVDWNGLELFMEKHKEEKIFMFGFTFMVWKYFCKAAIEQNKKVDLNNSILIHSGGWKKLLDEAVDNDTFKKVLHTNLGIPNVHNFYGMVEQVGSIFMECEKGHLHAPSFADILVRDPETLEVLDFHQKGLIQVLSVLPKSYPGHSLLTEDLGEIHGEDTCSCGRKGKYFSVYGRLPKAEIRGCSDTQAASEEDRNASIIS